MNSNSLLPEDIKMKTEDQILAQLRATQNGPPSQQFMSDLQGPSSTPKPDEGYPPNVSATPNMEELHKLIQTETLTGQASATNVSSVGSSTPLLEPDNIEQQVSDSLFCHVVNFY